MTIPPGKDLGDVRLGELTFNTVDAAGCAWILNDLDGWWNLPEADLPDDPRAYQYDGSYATDGRFKARDITLSGMIVPDQNSISTAATARQQLLSVVAAVRHDMTLVVDESDASKTAQCRLAGRPQVAISQLNGAVVFQIPLRAADPRKYSTEIASFDGGIATVSGGRTYPLVYPRTYPAGGTAGLIDAYNAGNYDTGGQFILTGPVTSPSIENIEAGKTLRFDITLGLTDTLTIDLASHSVILNGTASRRNTLTTDSTWFMLAPGANTIRYGGTSGVGSPTMNLQYQSAWIG